MELVAITLARVTTLLQLQTWDPYGRTSTVDALQMLAAAFTFSKYPKSLAEIDIQKGIELVDGRMRDIVIDKITIYVNGFIVDTRSSTENSEAIVATILKSIHSAFGAVISPERKTFTSQVIFRSDITLLALQPPILKDVSMRLTDTTSADLKHPFSFEPTGVIINADLSQSKIPPSPLTIERLADTPFSERLFSSTAPLRTNEHLEVLEQFEAALLQSR